MKQYIEIQGPNKAPRENCVAFYKYDGSNIRAEWTRKKGWCKFGSRKVLIDATHPMGDAIAIFLDTYGDDLEKIFKSNKLFRDCQNVTVFGEYFGENSFAGQHDPNDQKEIILFDVSVHKKGMMSPNDFVKIFGHLKIPEIIYQGKFNTSFIHDVKNGKYPVIEGIVAKGNLPHGRPPHNLWMAKVKTRTWIDKLKAEALKDPSKFKNELADNISEQE